MYTTLDQSDFCEKDRYPLWFIKLSSCSLGMHAIKKVSDPREDGANILLELSRIRDLADLLWRRPDIGAVLVGKIAKDC